MPRRVIGLPGEIYGGLTIIGEAPVASCPSNPNVRRVVCVCECGAETTVLLMHLRSGSTVSCGCAHGHGHASHIRGRTPTYLTWTSMRARCNRPTMGSFEHYGGRGIRVCARWDSFQNFLADMGERPEGHTLDRIDSDGNYEPSNCRWATLSQQRRNRRDSVAVAA